MKQKAINIIMAVLLFILYCIVVNDHFAFQKKIQIIDTSVVVLKQATFKDKSPQDGLLEALRYYGIKHPDIVYAQAILETGYFKSSVCQNSNNLFGLYDSKVGKYYRFKHWTESVIAYKNYIQNKYKSDSSYYEFLESINYAEDPHYIKKLKTIIK